MAVVVLAEIVNTLHTNSHTSCCIIRLVEGYKHPLGTKVTEPTVDDIEEMLYSGIVNDKDGRTMAGEWGVSEIILFAKRVARAKERYFCVPQSRELAPAVFKYIQYENKDVKKYFHKIFDEDSELQDESTIAVSIEMMNLLDDTSSI